MGFYFPYTSPIFALQSHEMYQPYNLSTLIEKARQNKNKHPYLDLIKYIYVNQRPKIVINKIKKTDRENKKSLPVYYIIIENI